MDNQHRKITGYRELTQAEIDSMNECKELERSLKDLIQRLKANSSYDQRWVSTAQTHLELGIMSAVRAIARPE